MCLVSSNRINNNTGSSFYTNDTLSFQMPNEIVKWVSVYLLFDSEYRRSVTLAMRLYTVPCVFTRSLSRIRSGYERVEVFKVKTVKVKWEDLYAKLAASKGKKMFWNYERTVHCSNTAINNANNFMTPYESTDLAAVKRERTLFAG
jgi:hypothetical protein